MIWVRILELDVEVSSPPPPHPVSRGVSVGDRSIVDFYFPFFLLIRWCCCYFRLNEGRGFFFFVPQRQLSLCS